MISDRSETTTRLPKSVSGFVTDRRVFVCAWALALFVLFHGLGLPALFEPDEGRNAEKAREILLLSDWVIPHENFVPVLDKPIFFYWLIAASYKLFGSSEWAARLPSAIAALVCLTLVYRFARSEWGTGAGVWSLLILATSLEFFILSRIVIFDMSLTLFTTLAIFCFYRGLHGLPEKRKAYYAVMYAAVGAGILVKGPIGLVLPGMVGFFYFLLGRQWPRLKEMNIAVGALFVLAIVSPWYALAESQNPGYLRYFFWDENIERFLSPEFGRSQPWYYFIGILAVGFSPWVFFLPLVADNIKKRFSENSHLFLLLWAAAPFLFFSLSTAKLPHYILPVFPPLALLTGKAACDFITQPREGKSWALHLPWLFYMANVVYLFAGWKFPGILPVYFRHEMDRLIFWVWSWAGGLAILYWYFTRSLADGSSRRPARLWYCYAAGGALCVLVAIQIMSVVSDDRSAKPIAQQILSLAREERQVVFYDTYMAGMAFYLNSTRPVWVVTHEHKTKTILGNFYALERHARPTTRYGEAIFTFDEFKPIWRDPKQRLIVVVKEKNLSRMNQQLGVEGVIRGRVDEYVLIINQPPEGASPGIPEVTDRVTSFTEPRLSLRRTE